MNIYDVLTVEELYSNNDNNKMLYVIFRTEHAIDSSHFFILHVTEVTTKNRISEELSICTSNAITPVNFAFRFTNISFDSIQNEN